MNAEFQFQYIGGHLAFSIFFIYNFFFLCSSIFQHTFLQSYILPEGFSICFWSHLQVSAFFTLVILAFPWSLSSLLQMLSPIILYRCFILYFLTAWILQNNRQVVLKIFNMLHKKKETAKNAHHKNVTGQYFQYLNTTMQLTTQYMQSKLSWQLSKNIVQETTSRFHYWDLLGDSVAKFKTHPADLNVFSVQTWYLTRKFICSAAGLKCNLY